MDFCTITLEWVIQTPPARLLVLTLLPAMMAFTSTIVAFSVSHSHARPTLVLFRLL
jgi:hypothetical protein